MTETKLVKAKYILTETSGQRKQIPVILKDAAVAIEDNKIVEVGMAEQFRTSKFDEVKDFPHHLLMPGFANTHSHAAMTLYRGYADDLGLFEWLNDYIWPIEAKTKPEDIKIGAKLAVVEALMSGTTTFNSMYWEAREEASSFTEVGVRLMCGPGFLTGIAEPSIGEVDSIVKDLHGKFNDMVRVAMFPHAPYTVTTEDYQRLMDYVLEYNQRFEQSPPLMMHTHLHESRDEMQQIRSFIDKMGLETPDFNTPTEYMNSMGILNKYLFVAHAVECSDSDIQLLSENNVGVAINTVSNLKLSNKFAPVIQYYDQGLKMGLGTDSATSNNNLDMFEEMKTTAIVHKAHRGNPIRPRAYEIIKMATGYGAEMMGWGDTGNIRSGSYADMITVNLKVPHLRPVISQKSLYSHIVYAARGADVSDVMVNGKWRMVERQLVSVELDALLDEFDGVVKELMER